MAKKTIKISSVASPEPQIVTIDSDPNESTIPYVFGNQHPIVTSQLAAQPIQRVGYYGRDSTRQKIQPQSP